MEGLTVLGGKMKNPFFTPGENEIIWDVDLNPEGTAVQYSGSKNGFGIFMNATYSTITERAAGNDTFLLGEQGGINCNAPKGKFTLGASYYDYRNMKNQLPVYLPTKSFGNSLNKSGKYCNDYNDLEVFGEYYFNKIIYKPCFYADYVSNIAEDVNGKTAWITGVKLGETQKPGSYSFNCSYRKEERNSVPGAFVDSAFIGGGTDGSGCKFNFDYQTSLKSRITLTYFLNKKNLREEKDYQRFFIDFNFKI